MSQLQAIEDALIEKIKSMFGTLIPTVDWAPPGWDEDFVKQVMLKLPGVFVVFGGGQSKKISELNSVIDSQWAIVAATKHANSVKLRARGDKSTLGCYGILERIAPVFDGFTVKDQAFGEIGTLELLEWNNASSLTLDQQSLMFQSLEFRMPITLESSEVGGNLAPFKTFADRFEIGQKDGAPETGDIVELPQ